MRTNLKNYWFFYIFFVSNVLSLRTNLIKICLKTTNKDSLLCAIMYLSEEVGEVVGILRLPDALPSTSLRGFYHDGEADLVGRLQSLVHVLHAALPVEVRGHAHWLVILLVVLQGQA